MSLTNNPVEDPPASPVLARTYVYHKGKCFYVSTINRCSSAVLAMGSEYAETMVWEWDVIKQRQGDLIKQDEATKDSLFVHLRIVERLFATGDANHEQL